MDPNSASEKQTMAKKKKVPLDEMSRQELKECAQVLTVKCERYKEKLRHSQIVYQELQQAYQRIKQRNEALGKELEEALGVRRETLKDGQHKEDRAVVGGSSHCKARIAKEDVPIPENKRCVDPREGNPRKRRISDEYTSLTDVSDTHLGGTMPSGLKVLAETEESQNTSQKDLLDSPSFTFMQKKENSAKSPAWKSVKKAPRPLGCSATMKSMPCNIPEQALDTKPEVNEDRAFKYMEIIRKQDERKKLPAGFCPDCLKFYKAYAEFGDLDRANEMVKRLCGHSIHQETSRHRRKYDPPPSPPDYWDIEHLEPHS